MLPHSLARFRAIRKHLKVCKQSDLMRRLPASGNAKVKVSASFLVYLYDASILMLFSHSGCTELPDGWSADQERLQLAFPAGLAWRLDAEVSYSDWPVVLPG